MMTHYLLSRSCRRWFSGELFQRILSQASQERFWTAFLVFFFVFYRNSQILVTATARALMIGHLFRSVDFFYWQSESV